MKKISLVLLTVCILLAFALNFSTKIFARADEHVCASNGGFIVVSPPTLTQSGLAQKKCDTCGAVLQTVSLDSLSHADVWDMGEITMPSFKNEGNVIYIYKTDASIVVNFKLPKLNDTGVYNLSGYVKPTLETEGQISFAHKELSAVGGTVTLEKLGDENAWAKVVVTEADCQNTGLANFTYILHTELTAEGVVIPKKEHDYKWIFATKPTTTSGGLAKYACLNAPSGYDCFLFSFETPSLPTTNASNDSYEFEIVQKPTLSTKGVGRFIFKQGEKLYEDLFVEVEISELVLKRFYVEEGKLYIEYADGTVECLGTVQGEQGVPGEKGDTGEQGIPGEKGEQGVPGEKGDTGEQGIPGEKGDTGAPGSAGAAGPKGDVGVTGAKGDDGVDGKSYTAVTVVSVTFSVISSGFAIAMFIILKKRKFF